MYKLPAPTHSGPSHVLATRGTEETEWHAMVGPRILVPLSIKMH